MGVPVEKDFPVLKRLWLDVRSPIAFTGRDRLLKAAKQKGISARAVDAFLRRQIAYSRHFKRYKKYTTSFYNVPRLYKLVEIDLLTLEKSLVEENNNIKYLLVLIEAMSRKVFVQPLKDKSGKHVADALEKIFKQIKYPIHTIRSDLGKEFRNVHITALLKKYHIVQKFSAHDTKSALVERVIQTLSSRLYRYMTYKNTLRFLPELQNIVKAYNRTEHSSTGLPPETVRKKDEYALWEKNMLQHMKRAKTRGRRHSFGHREREYRVGDTVRISLFADPLQKSFRGTFSSEVFRVIGIKRSKPVLYFLEDLDGAVIKGGFHFFELVRVDLPREDEPYEIDEILKKRTRKGVKEVFVSYRNYPSSFNQWIPASHLQTR